MAAPATVSRSEILDSIARLAEEQVVWDGTLREDMRLVEDLELDSIKLLTLTVAVEDHFRICLEEEEEGQVVTVGDLITLIVEKRDG